MSLDGQRSLLYAIWLCIFGNLGFDFRFAPPDCPAKEENKEGIALPPPPRNNFNFFSLVFLFWLELVFVGFLFSCVFMFVLCFMLLFFSFCFLSACFPDSRHMRISP